MNKELPTKVFCVMYDTGEAATPCRLVAIFYDKHKANEWIESTSCSDDYQIHEVAVS